MICFDSECGQYLLPTECSLGFQCHSVPDRRLLCPKGSTRLLPLAEACDTECSQALQMQAEARGRNKCGFCTVTLIFPEVGCGCRRLQVREACNFEGFATRRIQSALRLAAYDERSRLAEMLRSGSIRSPLRCDIG